MVMALGLSQDAERPPNSVTNHGFAPAGEFGDLGREFQELNVGWRELIAERV